MPAVVRLFRYYYWGVGRAGAISDVAAELIEHCAEWVTRDGQQLETILKNRGAGQPGWEFLFADAAGDAAASYYRSCLEAEMQKLILQSSHRGSDIYIDLTGQASPTAVADADGGGQHQDAVS